MEKVVNEGVTVTAADAEDPTAVAVKVAVPAPPATPATEVVNLPAPSVTPDAGLNVIEPVPEAVMDMGAPTTAAPCEFLAMNTTGTGEEPSSGTVAPLPEKLVSVEPTIWIGICVRAPAVAVMVAVRLTKLLVPEEKVKVAVPVASVVTVCALMMPVSAPKVTTILGRAALLALSAVTVKVVEPELSEGTVVGMADSESVAATGVVVVVVVVVAVVLGGPPAPQPVRSAAVPAIRINHLARVKKVVRKAAP